MLSSIDSGCYFFKSKLPETIKIDVFFQWKVLRNQLEWEITMVESKKQKFESASNFDQNAPERKPIDPFAYFSQFMKIKKIMNINLSFACIV